jgi:hypothetical protein
VVEAAPNYGEEWSCNYELRRFGGAEEMSYGGGPQSFCRIASRREELTVVEELRICIGSKGDLLVASILGWLLIFFSAMPVARPRNCILFSCGIV